jgi:hypothetical protein
MDWNDKRQRLARAVYAAAKFESRFAPMDHVVSTGNVLMRAFAKDYLPMVPGAPVSATLVNSNALTVRDALGGNSRFSGTIPAHGGQPQISQARGGALYCAKDLRSQMAEMLQYSDGHEARVPGSLPFPLAALASRVLVLIKPRQDLALVTLDGGGANVDQFYDRLQQFSGVKPALAALGYRDITEAIFSPDDYSAARGVGLGLISNPGIDGIEIGSARSFETVTASSAMSIFKSGTNVLLFGQTIQVLSHQLRVIALMTVQQAASGAWQVKRYEPGPSGDFVMKTTTKL